jgi:two-component system, NarL family, sensor histidine kinase DevS
MPGAAYDSDALDESRLRELIEVGRGLVAELDPEVVLARVLEVACELTGARYAALGVLDDERRRLERFITHGIDAETRRAIGDPPSGLGVLGLLIEEPRPLRLADVGAHPRSYGFPPGHPPMRDFLGVPIVIRGEAWGNLYLTEKRGGEFDDADEQSARVLAEWTAIAVDNARLYQSVESQRDEMEHAVRRLEAMTEVARAVGGETDLDRILETIVKRGRALVRARGMLILLRDGGEVVVVASAGEFPSDLLGERVRGEGSISGHVMATRRAERLANVGDRLRFELADRVYAKSGLFVPLVFRGEALGTLNAFDHNGGEEFTPEDQRLLESFAASAAVAVATAQSVAEDRMRDSIDAAERERGRWARELHDESLQSMAGLRVLLSAARRRGGADEKTDRILAHAVEQIDDSIAEMRRLIADLRPAALDELGLAPTLEALAERMGSEGLAVELKADLAHDAERGPGRLLPHIEDTVYRLVQEALNNAARHGAGERAVVEVVEDDGKVRVLVRDDGQGFDPAAASRGFGLVGMRERVMLAGGTLELRSAPGDGTTIVAVLPALHRGEEGGAAGYPGRLTAAL